MLHALRHRGPTALRLSVALVAIALLAAGCGDDDADVASTPTTTAAAETTTTTAAASSSSDGYGGSASATTTEAGTAGGSPAVEVAETSLGSVLASDGRTLYAFTPDTAGVSTCYDDCATNWPPLLATGDVKAGGDLDAGLFATSARTDGAMQVTVDGQPLYFFAGDSTPGDTNGQGVGDKWYVVGADGAMITG